MPIIPSQRQPISMDVPGMNVPTVGNQTASALVQAGAAIADTSLDLLQQVKHSEAIEASSKAFFEDRYASEDKQSELKRMFPDGYILDDAGQRVKNADATDRTITQEYRDWANKRYEDNQLKMPSKVAQEMYAQKAGQYYSDTMIQVRNDEMIQRVEGFKRSEETKLNTSLNRQAQAPSVSRAYADMDDFVVNREAQKGKLFGHQAAFEGNQRIKAEVPQSYFDGMINHALAEPKGSASRTDVIRQALGVLHGEDAESKRREGSGLYTISNSMNPDQKADIERKLLTMLDAAKQMDLSDLRAKTAAAHSSLEIGEKVPFSPLKAGWQKALAEGAVTPFEYAEQVGGLVAHDKALPVVSSTAFLLAHPDEKQAQIEKVAEEAYKAFVAETPPEVLKEFPQVGATARQQILERVTEVGKKQDDLLKEDFVRGAGVAYQIASYSKALNGFSNPPQNIAQNGLFLHYRSDMLEKIGERHFRGKSPDFRLLTKEESQHLSDFLKDETKGHSLVADTLVSLYRTDKRHYGSIIDQMIRDKNLGGEWRIVLVNPNRVLISEFVQTIRDGAKIRDDAQKVMQAKGATTADFENGVQKSAGNILMSMTQSNRDSSIAELERQQMRNVIITKAMDLYRREGGARTPDEYARMATEAWLGSRYKNIEVGGFMGFGNTAGTGLFPKKANINIPAEYSAYEDNVKANSARYLRPDYLQAKGAVLPPGMSDIEKSKFWEQVAETATFPQTADQTGYEIHYFDRKANSYLPVFTFRRDKNGRQIPLVIPISDMIKTPPKAEGGSKGFFERIKEAIVP